MILWIANFNTLFCRTIRDDLFGIHTPSLQIALHLADITYPEANRVQSLGIVRGRENLEPLTRTQEIADGIRPETPARAFWEFQRVFIELARLLDVCHAKAN